MKVVQETTVFEVASEDGGAKVQVLVQNVGELIGVTDIKVFGDVNAVADDTDYTDENDPDAPEFADASTGAF